MALKNIIDQNNMAVAVMNCFIRTFRSMNTTMAKSENSHEMQSIEISLNIEWQN
jgi:hypothetical protein